MKSRGNRAEIILNTLIVVLVLILLTITGRQFLQRTTAWLAGREHALPAVRESETPPAVHPCLSIEQAGQLMNRPALAILDTRSREEFKSCHLKGAVNIPSAEIEVRALNEISTDAPVLLANDPPHQIRDTLIRMGWAEVHTICGGKQSWQKLNSVATEKAP